MGRKETEKRQTTVLPFKGKPVKLYRPTDGQASAMFLASKKDGDAAVLTFFRVIEKLVVDPSDWGRMEELMIDGSAKVKDFSELFTDLHTYDWPEVEDAPADGE